MKMKLFIAAVFSLLSSVALANQSLPPCSSDVCTQVVHNKELEKLSVLVWDNQGQIVHSSELNLDRTAKLVHSSNENGLSNLNDVDVYTPASDSNPPAPCSSGSCSTSSSSTYTTATHTVTVTITYTYVNGELVGVNTSTYRVPREVKDID
ncbi:MAG: hypothetical protein ACQEQ2_12110 [Pseudomonadota bacterium]